MSVAWDPRAEDDKLAALADIVTAMHHGRPALEHRLNELAPGYPGKGDGGGSNAPEDDDEPKPVFDDPATKERKAYLRDLERSLDHAARAWERYTRLVQPRDGIEKQADPGCDLCAEVEGHWCAVYGARVIMTEPRSKKGRPQIRVLRLCQWCFQFTWPSRAGRLPEHEEVVAHSEQRRVNWKGGVGPKLVEVACPECRDKDRAARRACSTCGHSGKVLKEAS